MVDRATVFEAAGYSLFGPVALNINAPDEGNIHLLDHVATAGQRERYLQPLVQGTYRSAFAMTEPAPGAGSDPAALTTTATRVDGGWTITGHKWFITGGRSNLTVRLEDGASRWVLRMPPRTGRTPSAHDVAREFRVTSALRQTAVPVAPAVALCEDDALLGGPFVISEFVAGLTVQARADLDQLDDATVAALTGRLVDVLTALHAVDYQAVGLERFGRPDGYAARQIRRWSGQWGLVGPGDSERQHAAIALSARLSSAVPEQRAVGIVHGDYRIDNTLLQLDGQPAVAAVVDWELSTIGDPVADVAMMCIYRHPAFDLIVGGPSAWTSDRLPDVESLAAAYEAAGGVRLAHWDFHLALAYFKIAVIAAGIDHRHRAGSGSGAGFDSAGQAIAPFLEAGLQAIARTDRR